MDTSQQPLPCRSHMVVSKRASTPIDSWVSKKSGRETEPACHLKVTPTPDAIGDHRVSNYNARLTAFCKELFLRKHQDLHFVVRAVCPLRLTAPNGCPPMLLV